MMLASQAWKLGGRTWLSAVATFLVVEGLCLALHTGASPAILATVIAVSLARRSDGTEHQHFLVDAAGLVVVGAAATGVGLLLRADLPVGAFVFTLALGVSVLLRGFGDDVRMIGRAIGLPFITLLVVPPPADPHPLARIIVAVGPLVALAIVRALQRPTEPSVTPPVPRRASSLRPPPHVRMALQTTVALALAFVLGIWLLPEHWSWSVITAYIVCASARGRAEAVYTGVMRTVGATGGAVVATVVAIAVPHDGAIIAALVFGVLFAGLILRSRNYAYWAAATTAIFALLSQFEATLSLHLVLSRIEGIAIGGICGVFAAATLFPISTVDIVRRRLADALARLEALEEGNRSEIARSITHAATDLRALESALRVRAIVRRAGDDPAEWVVLANSLAARVNDETIAIERLRGNGRRARAALRDRQGVSEALRRLLKAD